MTHHEYQPGSDDTAAAQPSAGQLARDQASDLGQAARGAGGEVASTAADAAKGAAVQARQQTSDLLGQAKGHLRTQAQAQQRQLASRLHGVAGDLSAAAANNSQNAVQADLARRSAGILHDAASWLEQREPEDVVAEVRAFTRRRPGAALLAAAMAGIVAGRLGRRRRS
jgi:hypothetical protein